MALAVTSLRPACARGIARSSAGRVPARARLVVRAGLGDAFSGVAEAFTTIFSPPKHTNVPWNGAGSSFSGRISHRPGKPFSDGFGAGTKTHATGALEQADDAVDAAAAPLVADEGLAGYVSGAVRRVVGHNFKGDATEPQWAGTGWKGDIHTKKRDGFHIGKKHKA